jgi:hypothetical protein
MKRLFALLAAFVFLFMFTSGCISIYLAKELLVPSDEKPVEYVFKSYHFADNFTSSPPPGEVIQLYDEEFEVEVKPETENMRIDISVFMRSADEIIEIINDSFPDGQFKDLLMEFLETALEFTDQRYIEVTVKFPDGDEFDKFRFNQTEHVEIPIISSPNVGTWIIEVKGAGIGIDEISGVEYHDSFSVNVIVKEIKE